MKLDKFHRTHRKQHSVFAAKAELLATFMAKKHNRISLSKIFLVKFLGF